MTSMNKIAVYAVAVNMALLLASCSQSVPDTVSSAKVSGARKFVEDQAIPDPAAGKPIGFRVFAEGDSKVQSIKITPTRIKIVTATDIPPEGNIFLFSLKQLTPDAVCDDTMCLVSVIRQGYMDLGNYRSYEFYIPKNKSGNVADTVVRLTRALVTLKRAAIQPRSTDAQFQKVVDGYHAASPKPTLSPAVQRFKVEAENAARDKRFDDAVDEDAQALEIAPWWPEGHYNLALNWAGAKDYRSAIDEMQCYLMLVPDAANAEAAQNKIDEWEKKTSKRKKWYQF